MIQAFVEAGARQAFGPTLHIEGDALLLSGWWQTAVRLSHDAFMLRNEEPPSETSVLEDMAGVLKAQGLQQVGEDYPLMQPITYTLLSVVGLSWTLWAPDKESGEQALTDKAGEESVFRDFTAADTGQIDFSAELEGARRIAGLPPTVILTVGIERPNLQQLQVGLTQCRFEARQFGEIQPEACSTVSPTLVVVDATAQTGRDFVMELRAAACGRFLPVVAVAEGLDPPPGADVAVDPAGPATSWIDSIRRLLPQ